MQFPEPLAKAVTFCINALPALSVVVKQAAVHSQHRAEFFYAVRPA